MADILKFEPRQTTVGSTTHRAAQAGRLVIGPEPTNDGGSVARKPIVTADELYHPAPSEPQTVLSSALLLLIEAERQLADGMDAVKDDNLLAADDAMQRFQALLPELFCCRSLGDGFATVVSAHYHALKNLTGMPVDKAHVSAAYNSVRQLRRTPFLSYDVALSMVAALEVVGLNVEPPGLSIIGDLLID